MRNRLEWAVLAVSLAAGLLVGLLDNSPGWDDTAITVGALLLASALMGLLAPRLPWLWGLAVGVWVPLIGLAQHGNAGGAIALVFALAGAYAGAGVRKLVGSAPGKG